jgi:hypothetical protein
MTSFLKRSGIRIFDYPRFASGLRDEIRENAELIAKESGLNVEFIQKKNVRKEARVKKILEKRGYHPGLVHIFSAMESCSSYKPWHNKKTHETYLRYTRSKCLHYYFYFIDEELGLCYVRVPTWCPFRLQVYFNGHNLLAMSLRKKNINYKLEDNAFLSIDDFAKAQDISDSLTVKTIHEKFDIFAKRFCPIIERFHLKYHWSIMQAEYATDIIFKRQKDLQPIYENIICTAVHTVKPKDIATFLGRKLHGNYQDEMGNRFNIRIEGSRIKHTMGSVSIKMYDKFGLILRIETTVNDASFFKHYRKVDHRDGSSSMRYAPMKKSIYSLAPLQELLVASNRRYIEFISTFDDVSTGINTLNKVTKTAVKNDRPYKGFNFFNEDDLMLLTAIVSGEFEISGFQNKQLRAKLNNKNSSQISRLLKRLHSHGLIRKIGHSYKYYVTKIGKKIISMGLKLKELFIVPELAVALLTEYQR